MKTRRILTAFVIAGVLLGCGKQPESRHIVILPDVSGSIDRTALEQAFQAIDELASHLHRGDRLTVIPILGDAEAEATGRILRFELPRNRQAYDTDLRDIQVKLSSSLKEMQANAISHPGSRTDILGTVALAVHEFQESDESDRTLIILSDFIQEDAEINFRRDARLCCLGFSARFSRQLIKKGSPVFPITHIYLGLLRSDEFTNLGIGRRAAIEAFWVNYLKSLGGTPEFSADGLGSLKRVITPR